MIKINLSDYRLVYYRKIDNKKFLVKRSSSTDYVLIEESNFKNKLFRTQHMLRKEFYSDAEVAKLAKKEFFSASICNKNLVSA